MAWLGEAKGAMATPEILEKGPLRAIGEHGIAPLGQ